MKLGIQNFQSHTETALDFKGLAFVVGLNSVGKSSLVRAVDYLLKNRSGEDFIKDNCQFTRVIFSVGEVTIVGEKRKSGGSWKYLVNKVPLTKVGRGRVAELDQLNLGPVKCAGADLDLNLWLETGDLFLVNMPDTQKFEFLTQVMPERSLLPVGKWIKQDLAERESSVVKNQTLVIDLEARIVQREGAIARLEKWPPRESAVSFGVKIKRLRDTLRVAREIQGVSERLCGAEGRKEKLSGVPKLETGIGPVGDVIKRLASLGRVGEDIKSTSVKRVIFNRRLACFKPVEVAPIEGKIGILDKLRGIVSKLEDLKLRKDESNRCLEGQVLKLVQLQDEKKKFKVCPFCESKL